MMTVNTQEYRDLNPMAVRVKQDFEVYRNGDELVIYQSKRGGIMATVLVLNKQQQMILKHKLNEVE